MEKHPAPDTHPPNPKFSNRQPTHPTELSSVSDEMKTKPSFVFRQKRADQSEVDPAELDHLKEPSSAREISLTRAGLSFNGRIQGLNAPLRGVVLGGPPRP